MTEINEAIQESVQDVAENVEANVADSFFGSEMFEKGVEYVKDAALVIVVIGSGRYVYKRWIAPKIESKFETWKKNREQKAAQKKLNNLADDLKDVKDDVVDIMKA